MVLRPPTNNKGKIITMSINKIGTIYIAVVSRQIDVIIDINYLNNTMGYTFIYNKRVFSWRCVAPTKFYDTECLEYNKIKVLNEV